MKHSPSFPPHLTAGFDRVLASMEKTEKFMEKSALEAEKSRIEAEKSRAAADKRIKNLHYETLTHLSSPPNCRF